MFERVKNFGIRYERRIGAAAFALGFLFDTLTLQRIDRLYDNIVLAGYLLLALASIVFLNAHAARRGSGAPASRVRGIAQFLLPLSLGGLFSGFLVFYSRSGSILTSAPFLISLSVLFIGNELFKKHYERFVFQMCVFFVALFSYCALIVPVVLRRMGDAVFLLSGALALFVFFVILRIVRRVAREEVEANKRILWPLIVMIGIFFNFLYFNNMIPPIPLSLKEIGVYHSIERTRGGEYRLSYEVPRWYEFGRATSETFHLVLGGSASALSSVYAPAELTTDIVHRWEYYDTAKRGWTTVNIVRFPISGGRLEGFRGYSQKERIAPGVWRVSVETERGQVIGRFAFDVLLASSSPVLETVAR